jgi:hypothetical protein
MQQTPGEADKFSASQEILHISWNPKVRYRIHSKPPSISVLSQINRVHVPIPLPEDPF